MQGTRLILQDYAEWLHQHHCFRVKSQEIVFGRVSLPEHAQPLDLVASWRPGDEEPLMVLTTLVVANIEQVLRYNTPAFLDQWIR